MLMVIKKSTGEVVTFSGINTSYPDGPVDAAPLIALAITIRGGSAGDYIEFRQNDIDYASTVQAVQSAGSTYATLDGSFNVTGLTFNEHMTVVLRTYGALEYDEEPIYNRGIWEFWVTLPATTIDTLVYFQIESSLNPNYSKAVTANGVSTVLGNDGATTTLPTARIAITPGILIAGEVTIILWTYHHGRQVFKLTCRNTPSDMARALVPTPFQEWYPMVGELNYTVKKPREMWMVSVQGGALDSYTFNSYTRSWMVGINGYSKPHATSGTPLLIYDVNMLTISQNPTFFTKDEVDHIGIAMKDMLDVVRLCYVIYNELNGAMDVTKVSDMVTAMRTLYMDYYGVGSAPF